MLFPEYTDSLFQSAQLVKHSNDRYSIMIKTTNEKNFEKPISINNLDTIYAIIEKENPIPLNTVTDDYIAKKPSQEYLLKQKKRQDQYDSVKTVAEITFQILFVLLEILAQAY